MTDRVLIQDVVPYELPSSLYKLGGPDAGVLQLPLSVHWGPDPRADLSRSGWGAKGVRLPHPRGNRRSTGATDEPAIATQRVAGAAAASALSSLVGGAVPGAPRPRQCRSLTTFSQPRPSRHRTASMATLTAANACS